MNHLPKCAGNAVAEHFKILFGEDRVHEVRPGEVKLEELPNLDGFSLVYGHLPMQYEEGLGRDRLRFSVMRDPIDRVLSAYFFYIQLKDANSPVVAEVDRLTLEQYVTSDDPRIQRTTCNEQARQLLGLHGPGTRDANEAAQLVAAKLQLLDRFFTIGIYERFQVSLDILSWKLRLPRFRAGVLVNRTQRNWHGQQFSDDLLEEIRVRNQVDIALYKVVSERFQLQSSEMMEDLISQRYFARCAPSAEKVVTVDFGGPVVGSGWYKTERSAHGPFRWMGGGKDGGTIYFPGRVGGSIKVRLYLIRLAAGVGREDITLFLDGRPMEWQFEPTPDARGDDHRANTRC